MTLVLPESPCYKDQDEHPLNLQKTLIVCGPLGSLGDFCFLSKPTLFQVIAIKNNLWVCGILYYDWC